MTDPHELHDVLTPPDVTQESVQPPPIVPIERDLDGEKDERDQQVAGMYDSTEGGL